MSDLHADESLCASVVELAKSAGRAILEAYRDEVRVTLKQDASPLTEADLRAHELIVTGLRALSSFPILSEEASGVSFEERSRWKSYWLVDPLDGTKEFVSRNGEFTVNIALIHDHAPVFGVVHAPAQGVTYYGRSAEPTAYKEVAGSPAVPIHAATCVERPLRVVGSRSHRDANLDAYLARLEQKVGNFELVSMGSSLKFCLLAEGRADLYPRLGPTSEWDTAAAQAVLEAAGGFVVTADANPLRYNTKSELLNPFFFAYADRSQPWYAI